MVSFINDVGRKCEKEVYLFVSSVPVLGDVLCAENNSNGIRVGLEEIFCKVDWNNAYNYNQWLILLIFSNYVALILAEHPIPDKLKLLMLVRNLYLLMIWLNIRMCLVAIFFFLLLIP